MGTARALVGIGFVSGSLVGLAACTTEPVWVTPSGVSLGVIDCTSPAPLEVGQRAEVCLARVIAETPDEIARCTRDGGRVGPVSPIDGRFACTYRKPVADAG